MREIKFRAWYDNRPLVGMRCGEVGMLCEGDNKGTTHPLDCIRYFKEGQPVTLMQFTGLKDKNGVEVYEGDILAFHVDWSEQPNKEVIFDNSFHSYVLLSGEEKEWVAKSSNHFKYWSTDEDNIYLLHEADSYEIEVIGNIHETPELLCAKK